MLKPVRRIVTGHDQNGRSVVLFDGIAANTVENPHWPGRGLTSLWATDSAPADNTGAVDAAARAFKLEPAAEGTTFVVTQVMPESDLGTMSAADRNKVLSATLAVADARSSQVDTSRHGGMHKTKTIDYLVLLSGEVTLVLEEGEVTLKPFDVVVQRGTNHVWVNRGTVPAVLAGVLIDAHPLPASSA